MDRTAADVGFEPDIPSDTETAVAQRDAVSGRVEMSDDQCLSWADEALGIQKREFGTYPVRDLPDHLRPPEGLAEEIHEINALLTAILMGTHALYFWLNANCPDIEAAQRTSLRLQEQHKMLNALVNSVAERPSGPF